MNLEEKDYMLMWMIYSGSPSIMEMAKEIGVRSPNAVYKRLVELQKQELVIQPEFKKHRSREVTSKGKSLLRQYGFSI